MSSAESAGEARTGWDVGALAEAMEIVSAGVGRTVTVERISDDAMRDQFRQAGMREQFADAVLGTSTELGTTSCPSSRVRPPTTTPTTLAGLGLEDALRPHLT